jgi:hypothetical protein
MKFSGHRRVGVELGIAIALVSFESYGQVAGIAAQGSTGGLVIPTADVLSQGSLALSYGNYQEPQLGTYSTQQNFSLGLGILPGLELFGRLANYTSTPPDAVLDSGIRDLSANVKVQLPDFWKGGPRLAVGMNDVSGGAVNFKSGYVVATQDWGPWSSTLGFASQSTTRNKTFYGAFGGVYWRAGDTGLTLMAEHDSQQAHAGVRWQSPPIAALNRTMLVATVQRTTESATHYGDGNANRASLALVVPFGENRARTADFRPTAAMELPEIGAGHDKPDSPAARRSALQWLHKLLVSAGLERVRVGTRSSALGNVLTVQYENHRYAHNEVDALGIVFGLASELAPAGAQRIQAVTLKEGLPLYETSIGVADFRQFLRDGAVGPLRGGLVWAPIAQAWSSDTDWEDGEDGASPFSRVRVEVKPDFRYTLGTDVGLLDYSLAANVEATAPLWRGATLRAGYTVPADYTQNVEERAIFSVIRHRPGLRTVALGQSWWMGRQFLARLDVGRFHYDVDGIQAEGVFIAPVSGDMMRLRGAAYNRAPGGIAGNDRAGSVSYLHNITPTSTLEAGMQLYSDSTYGPSLEWSRWFGDLRMQIFYRRGADSKFAGLQLSIPLTPRRGMQPGPVAVSGDPLYTQGIRTRLTSASDPVNYVQPWAIQDLRLERNLVLDALNAGRVSQPYMQSQLDRMREAFYLYGRPALP